MDPMRRISDPSVIYGEWGTIPSARTVPPDYGMLPHLLGRMQELDRAPLPPSRPFAPASHNSSIWPERLSGHGVAAHVSPLSVVNTASLAVQDAASLYPPFAPRSFVPVRFNVSSATIQTLSSARATPHATVDHNQHWLDEAYMRRLLNAQDGPWNIPRPTVQHPVRNFFLNSDVFSLPGFETMKHGPVASSDTITNQEFRFQYPPQPGFLPRNTAHHSRLEFGPPQHQSRDSTGWTQRSNSHHDMDCQRVCESTTMHQNVVPGPQSSRTEGIGPWKPSPFIRSNAEPAAAAISVRKLVPRTLAHPGDELVLSSYQVLLRHQIQIFQASDEDAFAKKRGRNKQIRVGQVGIRCKHCANVPPSQRQTGSMYFPASTAGLYQASLNVSSTHLQCGLCRNMPERLKEQFAALIGWTFILGKDRQRNGLD